MMTSIASYKVFPTENFYAAVAGVIILLLVAFPFDNAFFHFTTFILLFLTGLVIHQTGFQPLLDILKETRHVQLAFSAIILFMFFSNLINEQTGEAWRAFLIFIFRYWLLLVVLLYLCCCRLLTIRLIAFATFFSLIVQFLPFLPDIIDSSIFAQRFQGFSSNPNIIGLYAAIGVLLGSFCTKYEGKYKVAALVSGFALAGLSAIILIASGNRGSWVAVLAALLVFAAFGARRNPKTMAIFLAVITIFCFVIFNNFSLPMSRFNLLIEGNPSLRDQIWQNAFALFWEKPLLGFGLDTRAVLSESFFIYSEHNIFLSVLLALGIFGLGAYVYLLVSICSFALKDRSGVGLSLMTLLMGVGMFAFDFYRDQHFMIIFIVVTFLILRGHSDTHTPSDT